LKFVGTNPLGGDHTAFIDNVRITGSPVQAGVGVEWLVADQLGTPRMVVDHTGSLSDVKRHDYFPFGEDMLPDANWRNAAHGYGSVDGVRQKFGGKEWDSETELVFFKARYHSSVQGRFISTDPFVITPERFQDPQQFNLYSYVRNSPLHFVDPTGKTLSLSGDVNEARNQLCLQIGGDCDRISFNAKTNTFTVDLSGIDLTQNEGANLLNDVVNSEHHYDLSIGSTVETLGGTVKVGALNTNLDNNPDNRPLFKKGKIDKDKPKKGIDDQIGIDIKAVRFNRKSDNPSLETAMPYTVVFHELAEAYAKVDHHKQYDEAHQEAVEREMKLRGQRPYLKLHNPGSGPGDTIFVKQ
jgi:RHS repeat-associated protein